jgi:hypothetical protein
VSETAAQKRQRLGEGWHAYHDNVVLLVNWAETEGFSAAEIVSIVEKPWKWRTEFVIAYCKSKDAR